MAHDTQKKIIELAVRIFAIEGSEGLSMRRLAKEAGIAQSVIYHYFANKDILLKKMFRQTSVELGRLRRALPETDSASDMLKQRIEFQIDHAQQVVAVLKFYLGYRSLFPKISSGFIPNKAYLHIEEVLKRGVKTGEFIPMDIRAEAKVIAHAINGFLLEYFPYTPTESEKKELVDTIHRFIMRSISQS